LSAWELPWELPAGEKPWLAAHRGGGSSRLGGLPFRLKAHFEEKRLFVISAQNIILQTIFHIDIFKIFCSD
jgi:hypothetical protein